MRYCLRKYILLSNLFLVQLSFNQNLYADEAHHETKKSSGLSRCRELIGGIILAPLNTWLGLGVLRWGSSEEKKIFAKRSMANLALYSLLTLSVDSANRQWFTTSQKDFIQFANDHSQKNPDRVLVIDADPKNDAAKFDFYSSLSKTYPGVELETYRVLSAQDFVDFLEWRSKQLSVTRIEMLAHAEPGMIQIGNDVLAHADLLKLFHGKSFKGLTSPGAELRMFSCGAACKTEKDIEGNIVEIITKKMLASGGRSFSSARAIETHSLFGDSVLHFWGIYPTARFFVNTVPAIVMTDGKIQRRFVVYEYSPNSIDPMKRSEFP